MNPTFKDLFSLSNYSFNPYALPDLIVVIYCIILSILVLTKKKTKGLVLSPLLVSTALWLFFFTLLYLSKTAAIAFVWNKCAYGLGVCFISINSYLFAIHITEEIKKRGQKIILFCGYLLMLSFSFLSLFTDLIVAFPPRKFYWGFYGNPGPWHNLFLILWSGFAVKATHILYLHSRSQKNIVEKNRLKIFFYSYLFGYLGEIDFLPVYGIDFYPFGYLFVVFFLTFIAYNFIRYKALGIETVIHKTSLWLASIVLIILPIGIIEIFFFRFTIYWNMAINVAIASGFFLLFSYYYLSLRPQIDRLFGKRQFAYYELLGRIAEKVATSLDMEELSQKLLKELDSCIQPQKMFLWVFNEEKQKYFLIAQKLASQQPTFLKESGSMFLEGSDLVVGLLKDTQEVLEPPLIALNPRLRHLNESPYSSFLQEQTIDSVVPLVINNELIGILALGRKRSLRTYTKKDLEILKTLGEELGTSIYNALHHKDVIEKQRMEEELRLVREIQMSLLPQKSPQVAGLKVFGLMLPAKEVGGDYYDFIVPRASQENPEALDGLNSADGLVRNQIAVVIGDVSGKGLGAGLLMAMAKTAIHSYAHESISTKQVLQRTNSLLYQHLAGQKFMTLLYLLWQSESKTLTYSSAGHEHILVYRSQTQNLEVIRSGGLMLGILPDIGKFLEKKQLILKPADKVLLYTDGATEAQNYLTARFGLQSLLQSFKTHSQEPLPEMIQAIYNDVHAFMGDQPQYDDITLVGMEAE